MINAADAPIAARQAMSCHISVDSDAERGGDEEADQPELQRTLASEPVTERAGREQQAREHERVGGDDPLQLRGRRVQVARQRRDRDVEARVPDEDDEQAQAEDGEGPPALVVGGVVLGGGVGPESVGGGCIRGRGHEVTVTDFRLLAPIVNF